MFESWEDVLFLDEGVHELRLEIDDGDFNLNYIDVQ